MKSERILILPKGQYSATTAYTVLDMVEYQGKMYYCIKDNTGVAPTNTEYWKEFISYVSPFRLGVDNSKYGYYGSDGAFHEFGGTTTAIDVTMTPTSVIPTSNVQSALDYISGTDSTDIATITTNSTGGTNASIRVVHPSGSVDEILSYRSCLNTYKNYSFFAVQYNSSIFSWQVKALSQIKSNGVLYGVGDIVASWGYNVTKSLSMANMANAKSLFVLSEPDKSLVSETEKETWNNKSDFDGDYNSLTNKPTNNAIISEGNTTFWNVNNKTYVPKKNEIIVYTDFFVDKDNKLTPNIKIGDGLAYVVDLPFVNAELAKDVYSHINDNSIHVTVEDKLKWDSKISCSMDDDNENIIFFV